MHLVGFIIRIYHDARSSEWQTAICNTGSQKKSKEGERPLLRNSGHKIVVKLLLLLLLFRNQNNDRNQN